jgi:hypothetical protein
MKTLAAFHEFIRRMWHRPVDEPEPVVSAPEAESMVLLMERSHGAPEPESVSTSPRAGGYCVTVRHWGLHERRLYFVDGRTGEISWPKGLR